jgi:hypothetical protein
MTDDTTIRPELSELQPATRQHVFDHITANDTCCSTCGGTDFTIGHALYLGFLFLDEDTGAYLVALTCQNPDCGQPRTAIKLAASDLEQQPLLASPGADEQDGFDSTLDADMPDCPPAAVATGSRRLTRKQAGRTKQ